MSRTDDLRAYAEEQSVEAPGKPSALTAFLREMAQQDREFLLYDDGWRGWTYSRRDVAGMAGRFAARLRADGIGRGDRVLIWSESRPGYIAALWGCLLEGVVLVPLELQTSSALLYRIEERVRPKVILLGALVTGVETYPCPVWAVREIERGGAEAESSQTVVGDEETAEIIFTSGTTAEPKGVVMTHKNLAACIRPIEEQLAPYRRYLKWLAPLRVLDLLPMSHLFGQVVALLIAPVVPASVVFLNSSSPEEIAAQIAKRKVCALVSVPRVLEVLRTYVLHRFPETRDAGKIQRGPAKRWWHYRAVHWHFGWRFCCFVVGGAALPPDVEQFWSALGFVVAQGYGLTETAPIISFNHPFHSKGGTAGKPMAGLSVRLAEDGEVLVRGDSVTPGYFNMPAETAAAMEGQWLHTGDIGSLTAGGELVIRGRKKDVIVMPDGLKVFPDDVERVLSRMPGVRECAVVDREGVHAVLVLEPGTAGDDVLRQANQQLESHQKVRSFSVWAQPELPRTATTRKLKRAAIAEAVRRGTAELPKAGSSLTELLQRYAPGRVITPETTLEELGLSSLDRVELMLEMEDKLSITMDEGALARMEKVADLTRPCEPTRTFREPVYSRNIFCRFVRRVLLPALILPLTRLFAPATVMGRENLERIEGPVIFASNHQSYLDGPVILGSLRGRWRYRSAIAMWMEYFAPHFYPERYSVLRRMINSVLYGLATVVFNGFPLSQVDTGTRRTMRYMGELAEEGWSILIFPEGERTLTGEIGRFHPGVAMVASHVGVPVVPIRIAGVDRVLPRNSRRIHRARVEVRIGRPMLLTGDSYDKLAKDVEDAVRSL